jgi:hypothetical protein
VAILSAHRCALDTRIASVALALVVAVVSLPIVSGWIITDRHCSLTMDICHPAQAADVGNAPLYAAAPQLFLFNDGPHDAVLAVNDDYRVMIGRLREAPEGPPPKSLA